MNSQLQESQARQIVQRLHRLHDQVELFATHAGTLKLLSSVDGRALLQEADNLLRSLKASRIDFESLEAHVGTLSRSLSSRPPASGGMPPAAKGGNELRAGSNQFKQAVRHAEKEIRELYGAADAQLNSPARTPTAPDNL